MTLEESYGRVAFDAYRAHRAATTHDGRPIPPWDELGDGIRGAWEAAAWAALHTGQEGLSG